MIYYLAYGSNLHPLRLLERVPSSRLFGPGCIDGYRLVFRKRGRDGSAKCDLHRTGLPHDRVHGVVYTLSREDKPLLDAFEDLGKGYTDHQIEISCQDQAINCFTYLAQPEYIDEQLAPFHWYKQLVIEGVRHLGFPSHYLEMIKAEVSIEDPDESRRNLHNALLERMKNRTGQVPY